MAAARIILSMISMTIICACSNTAQNPQSITILRNADLLRNILSIKDLFLNEIIPDADYIERVFETKLVELNRSPTDNSPRIYRRFRNFGAWNDYRIPNGYFVDLLLLTERNSHSILSWTIGAAPINNNIPSCEIRSILDSNFPSNIYSITEQEKFGPSTEYSIRPHANPAALLVFGLNTRTCDVGFLIARQRH